jgi:two-component system sensor histidine kinase FlrB
MDGIPVNPAAPSTSEELQEAFNLFNQVSEQLTDAYRELQKQVEQLTQELAVANGELRRQLEEKENLSQRLSRLLAALPGGVIVLDGEGRVSEVNPAVASMLSGNLIGDAWSKICERELVPTSTQGEWLLGDTGRRVVISTNRIGEQGGEILLLHDVTEAYQLQDQLQRHKRLSSMGEMVAGLAHQLRTPLSAALLYTSHLRGELPAEDRERFADKALARLHSLEHLIREMLIFVRGGKHVQERISVAALIADVQQVMEPQMAQHGLIFQVDEVPLGLYMMGSREALSGALTNLLNNAMQACRPGQRVALTVETEGSGWLAFCVADNGKGIPQKLQDRMFEPFFTTRTEGTGLGLAIVREVTQMHGGEISLQSTEGVGSEFRLHFPVSEQEQEPTT